MEGGNLPYAVAVVAEEVFVHEHLPLQQAPAGLPHAPPAHQPFVANDVWSLPSPCPVTDMQLSERCRSCIRTLNMSFQRQGLGQPWYGASELVCINARPLASKRGNIPCKWVVNLVPNEMVQTVPPASWAMDFRGPLRVMKAGVIHNARFLQNSVGKGGGFAFWDHRPLVTYEATLLMQACVHTGILNGHYWAQPAHYHDDNEVLRNLIPKLD